MAVWEDGEVVKVVGSLWRGSTYLRWVYLLLGAALVLAFGLVDSGLIALVNELGGPLPMRVTLILIVVITLPLLLGILPAVREVEGIAVESLLGVRFDARPLGPAKTWAQRRRTAGWFLLHLLSGGLVGFLSTVAVPLAVVLFAAPFRDPGSRELLSGIHYEVAGRWTDLWFPLAAIGGLACLFLVAAGVGAVLARWAPRVLGPTPAERIELLERRTATLAERNRLARELHDSVGHALSLVTLQAGAARRVLATDPDFAMTALAAMETSARAALADLDHVLGLLREDDQAKRAPQSTLGDLTRLVDATRAGGISVAVHSDGDLAGLPAAVSREAYRIVQEGLTNAIRHAGRPADELSVDLSIRLDHDSLRLELSNPTDTSASPSRSTGGRGLAGIRERVAVLRGSVEAGTVDNRWRLAVTLPVANVKGIP